jgi:NifB/MoaA-like Fe-S oxidoreductase
MTNPLTLPTGRSALITQAEDVQAKERQRVEQNAALGMIAQIVVHPQLSLQEKVDQICKQLHQAHFLEVSYSLVQPGERARLRHEAASQGDTVEG